jgi:hypothetical protein
VIEMLAAENARLAGQVADLAARVARLERLASRNSEFSELGLHLGLRRVGLVLAASVSDGVDDEVEVGLVEPGDGVTQGDRCCGGEAGG